MRTFWRAVRSPCRFRKFGWWDDHYIEWKNFGVQLDFLPFVLEDESVRLTVTPEVSNLDPTLGTLLNGTSCRPEHPPGLDTVEMRQGQTLAIAGLLQVELNAQTDPSRAGDLPYLGPLFSNTSHRRIEKELLVLVTPHLVAPMNAEDVRACPRRIKDPMTWSSIYSIASKPDGTRFFLVAKIGRPVHLRQLIHLEQRNVCGPVGLSPPNKDRRNRKCYRNRSRPHGVSLRS